MTVRQFFTACLACGALLLGAGCGGDDRPSLGIETDDPIYQQGKLFQKQGRNPEALAAFLKVIERRGEQNAPESHFEVGALLVRQDPYTAIYHLNKYLELQPNPNSQQAALVRGLRDTAKKEILRMMPGRPDEEQSATLDLRTQLDRLKLENDQLKLELAALKGLPVNNSLRVTLSTVGPGGAGTAPVTSLAEPPVSLAPPPVEPPQNFPTAPAPAAPAGRRHTVAPHETLYGISRKYGVTMESIAAANPLALPTVNAPLRVGTDLKIP